jgi:SAM-dependent methyltransferase
MTHQSADQLFYAGASELFEQEQHLKKYCDEVARSIVAHTQGASRVLEFGAGIGTLAISHRRLTGVEPVCLEIDPNLAKVLVQRGLTCVSEDSIAPGSLQAIYSSNVLEHIEDDVAALRNLHRLIQPDGVVVLYQPAFQSIFTELDKLVGHYRRYGVKDLSSKLNQAGFEVVHWEYCDSIGFFAWWINGLRKIDPNKKLGSTRALHIYDRFVYPISRILDRIGLRYLFGKNLLMVATPRTS